ncbi:MAG: lysylphosphatidylglycerol synthase transmembrane domain-containing protein, partial [Gemmatimonadota bacterium]
ITQSWRASFQALVRLQPLWLLPALAVPVLDWLGGGLRLKVLLAPVGERLGLLACTQIAAVTTATAWLTPSGAGGGPAQIYGLTRNGVPLGRAGAVNAATFLSNLTFLALAGLTAWGAGAGRDIEHIVLPIGRLSAGVLFQWSAWGMAAAVLVILVLAFLPGVLSRLARRLFRRSPRLDRWLLHLDELRLGILTYVWSGKTAFVGGVLAASLHFGSRIVLGWILLRGFGVDAPFSHIILLHTMIQFLLVFMPTPGGAGIGEVLVPIVMAPFLDGTLLVAYTALWRFFMTYIPVAVGGGLLLTWLGRSPSRPPAALPGAGVGDERGR